MAMPGHGKLRPWVLTHLLLDIDGALVCMGAIFRSLALHNALRPCQGRFGRSSPASNTSASTLCDEPRVTGTSPEAVVMSSRTDLTFRRCHRRRHPPASRAPPSPVQTCPTRNRQACWLHRPDRNHAPMCRSHASAAPTVSLDSSHSPFWEQEEPYAQQVIVAKKHAIGPRV